MAGDSAEVCVKQYCMADTRPDHGQWLSKWPVIALRSVSNNGEVALLHVLLNE